MFKRSLLALALFASLIVGRPTPAAAATCTPTGFWRDGINMTAARINPSTVVTGEVNAWPCNIGVYYDSGSTGAVSAANIHGSNYFGIFVNGDTNAVSVSITNSEIHGIRENSPSGAQHGVAIYFRSFQGGKATGKIVGNQIFNYQKGGIVVNGLGATAQVNENTVTGQGPVSYIAQNGIQIGYGANAQVMRNTVIKNSYTGTGWASGGIIVVGGAGYGTCPDGNDCPYTTGTTIVGNTVRDNDVGVWLSNIDEAGDAPAIETNVKVTNNVISSGATTNGICYQAGIADQGNNDKLVNNTISGVGYNPATLSSVCNSAWIDADSQYTNRAKIHANSVG